MSKHLIINAVKPKCLSLNECSKLCDTEVRRPADQMSSNLADVFTYLTSW